jgi:2-dehydro-3-deoxygluconokinase
MTRYDFLTFGENMIRFSTRNYERLEQAQTLDIRHGGTESNTAMGLARLGHPAAWVSRLVNNALGRKIAGELSHWGVDTSHVVWTNDGRMGTFFLEVGSPPRPSSVLYDRRDSSMSRMCVADFPWPLLSETRWLHATGITTGISETCRELVGEAMRRGRTAGLTVSYDVNYRARLWSSEQARAGMSPLCTEADIMFVTQADAGRIFGAQGSSAEDTIRTLASSFARKAVVMTMGVQGAMGFDKESGTLFRAPAYTVPYTIDRIGAGDAFDAGFIAGYLEEGIAKGLAFGNAMAALKMTIHGDFPLVSRAEVEALVTGGSAGINR